MERTKKNIICVGLMGVMLFGAPGGGLRAYGKESAPVRVLLLGPEEASATAHSPRLALSGWPPNSLGCRPIPF